MEKEFSRPCLAEILKNHSLNDELCISGTKNVSLFIKHIVEQQAYPNTVESPEEIVITRFVKAGIIFSNSKNKVRK